MSGMHGPRAVSGMHGSLAMLTSRPSPPPHPVGFPKPATACPPYLELRDAARAASLAKDAVLPKA